MKWKNAPYVVIVFFTLIVGAVRYYIIRVWPLAIHIALLVVQYIMFIVFWKVTLAVAKFFEKKIPFRDHFLKRIILQILTSVIILSPVMFLVFIFGKPYVPAFVTREFYTLICILFVIVIVLMNFIAAASYFFKEWQQSVEEKAQWQVQAATAEKEKSMMQYHHLKNQVNPHFLFNTLSSLDGLIQCNPDLASSFLRHLSKVYRYVLEHKENEVVSLYTETTFIRHYISLLHIRYSDAVKICLDISDQGIEKGIVMVTLQMLIDNAIKHNIVQADMPLMIKVYDDAGFLYVQNNKQLRKQIDNSSMQGLLQLKQLYSYLSIQPVTIKEDEKKFEVKLPLL